ncbi:MAG: hypothetical protein ABSH08_04570 [Tepidisphaeraceae bacterium]|jgi:hypothetical protein
MPTHYFSRPPVLGAAKFADFVSDVRKLAKALPSDIVIRGRNGVGKPQINNKVVAFNGDSAQRAEREPLIIQQTYTLRPPSRMREGVFLDFCKTGGKRYDLIVVAALYAFIHRFPDCRFTTDATANELSDGYDLFMRVVKPAPSRASLFLFERPLKRD